MYDPLETVSYFKYCITPHPLESQETVLDEINIKKYVPQSVAQMKLCATFVAQMWHKMWHNLGCMGGNQYKYRKYVPQSVAQKLCATSATNVAQNVAQLVV